MRKGLEHFPELIDWNDDEVREAGYVRRSVSVFDHWLSPEEADSCRLFTIDEAAAAGLLPTYLQQESRFLRFYELIFADGAFRRHGRGRRLTGLTVHTHWDRRLKKAVRHSLRDRFHMDIYSPRFSLRVVGNWDRSDVLLFTTNNEAEIEGIANRCGLFLI